MHDFVETPIGYVIVDSDGETVSVSFKQTVEGSVRHDVHGLTSLFRLGKRPPKPQQEITQNGSTFEVIGVRVNGDGYDVLNGNTGAWEKWVED